MVSDDGTLSVLVIMCLFAVVHEVVRLHVEPGARQLERVLSQRLSCIIISNLKKVPSNLSKILAERAFCFESGHETCVSGHGGVLRLDGFLNKIIYCGTHGEVVGTEEVVPRPGKKLFRVDLALALLLLLRVKRVTTHDNCIYVLLKV